MHLTSNLVVEKEFGLTECRSKLIKPRRMLKHSVQLGPATSLRKCLGNRRGCAQNMRGEGSAKYHN